MNNIEELKKAALAATPGPWEKCDSYGPNENGTCVSAVERPDLMIASTTGYYGRDGGIANANFIALANPSAILDLIAQLEATQKSNAFLKEQMAQLANFNPDWDKLEACQDSWRELSALQKETLHRAELAEAALSAAKRRIDELEIHLKEERAANYVLRTALSAANEKLSKPVSIWKLNNFREAPAGGIEWAEGYVVANNRAVTAIRDAGFTVEGE
ncbi:ead/Ea22-like family protein [Yersinia enterocolitica]